MDLYYLSIREVHALLVKREISAVELTKAVLERIEILDPVIQAFITVSAELALKQAEAADDRIRRRDRITPLTGIPFAVKDCISTKGVRTTCSSKVLDCYVPPYNATVIERLYNAGAVLLGKTNMDEFGMGSSTENSAFFTTYNPWNLEHVPGGSSGGSAAVVTAGMSFFALGEDTGGSIRMPAAFCNVVGLKPTYGRVSRYGLIALASSFDTIGPMTRDVYDNALVLKHIAGFDPFDNTTSSQPVPIYSNLLTEDLNGIKIGLPREYFIEGMEPGVEHVLNKAIRDMESLGATIEEVSLPHTKYGIPVYYLILFAEASTNLARFDGVRFGLSLPIDAQEINETYFTTRTIGLGNEVKRRIIFGALALSAERYEDYYLQAQKVRSLIQQDFRNAFKTFDALITPVCPTTAFRIGEKIDDPLKMYLSDIYTVTANPSGVPALTIPIGFAEGLPVGMQLMGPHLAEDILFKIAHAYQGVTRWHLAQPDIDISIKSRQNI